jgi:DNA-directed RNA polymerase subunit RPC12/RpoP
MTSLVICANCKKEMVCIKTGKTAIFGKGHCYVGDEFACKTCGAKTLICTGAPYYIEAAVDKVKEFIHME